MVPAYSQKITSNDLSIDSLLKGFYNVPDFQREYVWGESQVERLLQDISYEYQDKDGNSEYFIGSIVVCSDDDKLFTLIDGQQRITTLIIFLCCLRDYFGEKNIQKDLIDVIKKQLYDTVVSEDGDVKYRSRLQLQYVDNQGVLDNLIMGGSSEGCIPTTKSAINITNAYDTIHNFLESEFKDDLQKVRKYYAYLINKVKLVRINTASVTHALKVFETINDRGVGLDSMDLLKNLLFLNTNASDYDQLKIIWKEITDTIYEAGEKPLRFLRYFILSSFTVEKLREDETYDWIVENKDKCKYDTNPLKFANSVRDYSKAYENFVLGKNSDGSSNRYLLNIKYLSGSARQHLILLLAAKDFAKDDFTYFSRVIENLFFTYIITREPAREFEKYFARWAPKIRQCKDRSSIDDFIIKELNPVKQELKSRFELALKEVRYDNIPKYRLRYILGKMTQYVNEQGLGNSSADLTVYLKQQDIEHVLSETIDVSILKEFDGDEAVANEYKQRLGNLALLEESINKAIHNLPFSKKKGKYSNSQYLLTKAIVKKLECGKIAKAVENLKQYDTWTTASIESRTAELIELAKKVWEID